VWWTIRSHQDAAANNVDSANGGHTSWIAIGKPFGATAMGNDTVGRPV
jgi:hypothetical protein